MSTRVLVISSDLEQLRMISASVERAGASVDSCSTVDTLPQGTIPYRYIFVALDNQGAKGLERLLPRLREEAHVAVVARQAGLAELTACLRDPRIHHVVAGEDAATAAFVIMQKLLTGDIFGIEKYLPPATPVHCVRLRDFEGRKAAIETVLAYAEQAQMRKQVRSAIAQVCEELLMNALYDAPVDARGVQVFGAVDPHDRVGALSPRPVSLRFAASETTFAIAVRDRFGRLAKNTIVAYIEKCLHSPTQIDRKAYGAGLGLYLVANTAASYVVNVAYDIATEVVCTFDRGAKAPLRLVSMFVHPEGSEHLSWGPTPATADRSRPPTPTRVGE